jgi:hypothetical protein
MAAVRDCAETMETQATDPSQVLLRLPMDEGLRARVVELVAGLKDASGRVTFELALLQTEMGEGEADTATVVERLTGMDALMMTAVAALADVVDELEKAAERDEQNEPAFARVTDDQTEALFGESGDGVVQGPSFDDLEWVNTWDDGLRLMDRYPWARLHPLYVHPDFVRTAAQRGRGGSGRGCSGERRLESHDGSETRRSKTVSDRLRGAAA